MYITVRVWGREGIEIPQIHTNGSKLPYHIKISNFITVQATRRENFYLKYILLLTRDNDCIQTNELGTVWKWLGWGRELTLCHTPITLNNFCTVPCWNIMYTDCNLIKYVQLLNWLNWEEKKHKHCCQIGLKKKINPIIKKVAKSLSIIHLF